MIINTFITEIKKMKIHIFFLLIIIYLLLDRTENYSAGRRHMQPRHRGQSGQFLMRKNTPHCENQNYRRFNHYSHGGRNHLNDVFATARAWGLGMIGDANALNSNQVVVMNQYNIDDNVTTSDNQDSNKNNMSEPYQKTRALLDLKVKEIINLSEKLADERVKMESAQIVTPFIKVFFSPYNRIDIVEEFSNDLYGDLKNTKIKIVHFKGNQKINTNIIHMSQDIKKLLQKLMAMTSSDNLNQIDSIKRELVDALKILNENVLDIVSMLKK